MSQSKSLTIIAPCYNDWSCIPYLYRDIQVAFDQLNAPFRLVIIDDHSKTSVPKSFFEKMPALEVIRLHRNLGHQKAIAIGLSYIAQEPIQNDVIVMDSDGEDRPQDIGSLIQKSKNHPDTIIFAERRKRSESTMFKFLYFFYKLAYKMLSGHIIRFGNFVLIPASKVRDLTYVSEIWNHFPGGIIRSKNPYDLVPIDRGTRYEGQSKMNFISLIQHGISSITVNIDFVSVRLLIFSFLLMLVSIFFIFGILWIKFFTSFAIPGWASSVVIGLIIIVLQAFSFSLLLSFIVLNNRTQLTFIPAIHYQDFIKEVDTSVTK